MTQQFQMKNNLTKKVELLLQKVADKLYGQNTTQFEVVRTKKGFHILNFKINGKHSIATEHNPSNLLRGLMVINHIENKTMTSRLKYLLAYK